MSEKEIREIFGKININVKEIEKAGNSYNSNVYIVSDGSNKYILKISNNHKKRINESKYYNYLSKFVPTSKVLCSDQINNIEYNVLTFFEGKNIYDEDCNSLSSKQIFNIGKLLGDIHSCPIIDKDDDSWTIYLIDCLNKTQNELAKIFGKEDNDVIQNFLSEFISKKIKDNYKNCILHMDFRVGNIMIANNNEVGIIDLESMKNGEYVFDFVKMNRIFNEDNFNIFLDGYKSVKSIDADFDEKLKFYSFFDSYTSLYWCVSKNQTDLDFYKLNHSIAMKYLGLIKKGVWSIQ